MRSPQPRPSGGPRQCAEQLGHSRTATTPSDEGGPDPPALGRLSDSPARQRHGRSTTAAGAPARCRAMDGHTRNFPPPANDRQRGPSWSVLMSQETARMLIRQADVRSGSRICCATEDSQSSRRRPPGCCIAAALDEGIELDADAMWALPRVSQAKRAAAGAPEVLRRAGRRARRVIQAAACVARSPGCRRSRGAASLDRAGSGSFAMGCDRVGRRRWRCRVGRPAMVCELVEVTRLVRLRERHNRDHSPAGRRPRRCICSPADPGPAS